MSHKDKQLFFENRRICSAKSNTLVYNPFWSKKVTNPSL